MVSYHYLNRLFIDRLPARSGCFKLSNAFESSARLNQYQAASRGEDKENLEPNEDLDWKLQKRLMKSLTLRHRLRQSSSRSRVRCKRFVRLDGDLMLANVIYAISSAMLSMLLLLALSGLQVESASGYLMTSASPPLARLDSRSPMMLFGPRPMLPPLGISWRRIASNILHGFGRLPSRRPSSSGSGAGELASSTRFPANQVNSMTRLANRLRQRIGARNTIRVHNAFRDFAWRVLGSLSMPTPVIYELRRQNFYPPGEDLENDNFFNRNTSKTIRSKRWADPVAPLGQSSSERLASKSDDDEEELETLRDRMRTRLDRVLALSRRSLFGRVVRLPSLLPFKRHEDEEGDDRNDGATGKTKQSASTSQRPRLVGFASRRKRRRELDRQIIEINGKQFYVDDDGELKELKEPT